MLINGWWHDWTPHIDTAQCHFSWIHIKQSNNQKTLFSVCTPMSPFTLALRASACCSVLLVERLVWMVRLQTATDKSWNKGLILIKSSSLVTLLLSASFSLWGGHQRFNLHYATALYLLMDSDCLTPAHFICMFITFTFKLNLHLSFFYHT